MTPASGLVRTLLIAAGLVCVGLAYLGSLLPGLPTTPWLLLASICFARSSPRLHRWLLRAPIFGRLLRDWHDHHGIRRSVKMVSCGLVLAACSFSIGFVPVMSWVKVVIGVCGVIGLSVILFVVPTLREADTLTESGETNAAGTGEAATTTESSFGVALTRSLEDSRTSIGTTLNDSALGMGVDVERDPTHESA